MPRACKGDEYRVNPLGLRDGYMSEKRRKRLTALSRRVFCSGEAARKAGNRIVGSGSFTILVRPGWTRGAR